MQAALRALVVLVVIAGVIGGIVAYSIARRGLSTRAEGTAPASSTPPSHEGRHE